MSDKIESESRAGRARASASDGVTVFSANPSFFLWIVILAGFVAGPLARAFPIWPGRSDGSIWACSYT